MIENYIKNQIDKSLSFKKTRINLFKKHILWYLIHSITFSYSENPKYEETQKYAEFFVLHLQNLLPNCNKCKLNYNKHIFLIYN